MVCEREKIYILSTLKHNTQKFCFVVIIITISGCCNLTKTRILFSAGNFNSRKNIDKCAVAVASSRARRKQEMIFFIFLNVLLLFRIKSRVFKTTEKI